jgi:hypothetical protein
MSETNVIAFEPRRQEAPALQYVEVCLDAACGIELVLCDNAGKVIAVLEYALTNKPEGFDLDLLREAWDRWRETSTIAS